jgi:hypothetical protein
VRVINTSDKPFEFSFDSVVRVMAPGQVFDFPVEIAQHAIKRSKVLDEMGNIIGFQVQTLEELGQDQSKMRSILSYECPFKVSGQCDAQPFKHENDLRAHLESHWATKPKEPEKEDLFAEINPKGTKNK